MVKRILEYPINQKLSQMSWPDIAELETHGKPIGGNRQRTEESHYLYSCECFTHEFQDWLSNLDECIEFRLYGCFEWEQFPLRVTRNFRGFSIYFPFGAPDFDLSWTSRAHPC